MFSAVGLEICQYDYYDAANHALDFDGLLNSLNAAQAGDVVLFHGCCHNPTGIDPTAEQWAKLAELSVAKAGCRCLTSPIRALPVGSKKMRKVCESLPHFTMS